MSEAPKKRFRESAVSVLLHGSGDQLEVYWARRSDVVTILPGFHAPICRSKAKPTT